MRKKVVALIDCNNFYVSCERVFNAALHTKPVLVLSNNDGCVVARSNDIKKLIKMGQPVFECQDSIKEHNIQVFSSNYSLYADLSARVMRVLSQFSSLVEVYSIDEAFIDLTALSIDDLTEFGQTIKANVLQQTGIPVSVGIATTKTLSKIANELVKKDPSYQGVLDLSSLPDDEIDEFLAKVPTEDVWGIGYAYASFLRGFCILTAKDVKYADDAWIRKHLTVVGQRTVFELRGMACIPLEIVRPAKKGIMSSKTFGREITRFDELEEAVATYTARAAEKLRDQDSAATSLTVFIRTNSFNTHIPHYDNSYTIRLPSPTAFTPDLIRCALQCLSLIYKEGYRYKKAGVFLTKIRSQDVFQPDLFGDVSLQKQQRQDVLMYLVDAINRIYGRDTLFFAMQGMIRPWKMQQRKLSHRFTTQWSEIYSVI